MGDREERGARPAAGGWRNALVYCARPHHLRRTLAIAVVVGALLCAINQLGVILDGRATTETWLRCGLDFVVPFTVSNLGLLTGRAEARGGSSDGSEYD